MLRSLLLTLAVLPSFSAAQEYDDNGWRIVSREPDQLISRQIHEDGKLVYDSDRQILQPLAKPVAFTSSATNIPDPVRQAYYSVAKVTKNEPGGSQSGSATYLGAGYWLTNAHVVLSQQKGRFTVTTKRGAVLPAEVVKVEYDQEPDLALVRTQSVDHLIRAIPLSDQAAREGDIVYPSGFDRGNLDWHTVWPARVNNDRYTNGSFSSVGLGARKGAISGNSGGPTFSANGELIAPLNTNVGGNTLDGSGGTGTVSWLHTRRFLLPFRQAIVDAIRTQCGPMGCPPGYGNTMPGGGIPQGQGGVPRPTLPDNPQDIPSFKPPATPTKPSSGSCPCQRDPSCPCKPDKLDLTPSNGDKIDYDKLADALLPKMKESGDFKGENGADGKSLPGPRGPQGEVTPEQLAAISTALLDRMSKDPKFRGPAGPAGPPGESAKLSPSDIADLTAKIKEQLNRRILVINSDSGDVIDDETYGPDEPFVFDITRFRTVRSGE